MTIDHNSILDLIRGTTEERHEAIKIMVSDVKLKSEVLSFVMKQKGDKDVALNIFHDSVIIFTKKVFTDRSLVIEGSHSAYLFGIAKNLWLMHLRKEKRNNELIDLPIELNDEERDLQLLFQKEKASLLQMILQKLPSGCREVLMFWAGGYSMVEIAEKLGYKSEGVARKKKFFCFKSLTDWLSDNPRTMEALKSE